MPKSIRPLHDRVVVRPDDVKKKTEGGIIIPDTVAEKPVQGTVVSTGQLCKEVLVKDAVLYTKGVGIPMKVDGHDCLIMRESDIIAIV